VNYYADGTGTVQYVTKHKKHFNGRFSVADILNVDIRGIVARDEDWLNVVSLKMHVRPEVCIKGRICYWFLVYFPETPGFK
jgi:hypothetical protein